MYVCGLLHYTSRRIRQTAPIQDATTRTPLSVGAITYFRIADIARSELAIPLPEQDAV